SALYKRVMPQLRCNHSGQTHFNRKALARTRPKVAVRESPVRYSLRIEVAGLAERLRTQELLDECRRLFLVKRIERRSEDDFWPPSDGPRQPALCQQPKQVLVAQAAQLPARVQPRQESEHVLVEKWVTSLDRRVHRHAVALGVQ